MTLGSAQAEIYGAKQTTLDNGMQVVVVENHRAPVVTHMVWYRVGAMDEPAGKSGIAHFLEHLMFKGTDTVGPGEFSATVARNGGQDNAFTSQDYTAYFQSVASDRLEMVMKLESDRMAHLKIAEDQFIPEKQVVLEERSMRTDNDPGSILQEQASSAFYRNHPYAIPVIGWRHEIEGLQLQDAVNFYKTFYTPNNAILVVSGDVEAEKVFDLARKYYGTIPARTLPDRPDLREPPLLVSSRVTYRDDRVRQPSLSIRKQAPSWTQADNKADSYALEVLSQILGGNSTSRLYRSLVIDQGIAVSTGSWYDGDGRGPGMMGLYVSPAQGVSLDKAEAALRAEVAVLLKDGVTQDEVTRAITRIQDSAATARDSLSGPAMNIGRALAVGFNLDDVETWPDKIGQVTVDQVNTVAQRVLAAPGEVVNILLPKSDTEATQ
ncbi:MAG: pitrilysin family protein [Alphaproteobacteria bacterium]|nr:pitrilysin family protein [Alphaproteobacteria bacterium]